MKKASYEVFFAAAPPKTETEKRVQNELVGHMRSRGSTVHLPYAFEGINEGLSPQDIYEIELARLHQSAAVVAEVSVPDPAAGYWLAEGQIGYRPGLALFSKQAAHRVPPAIEGARHVLPLKYERTRKGMIVAKTAIDIFLHDVYYGWPRRNKKRVDFYGDIARLTGDELITN